MKSNSTGRISSRILDKIRKCSNKDRVLEEFLKKILFEDPGPEKWYKKNYKQLIETYAVKWKEDGDEG